MAVSGKKVEPDAALNTDQCKKAAVKKKDERDVFNLDLTNKKINAVSSAVDNFSKPWLDFLSDACSCHSCNSYDCFALRHHSGVGCTCKNCKRDDMCNFYNNLTNNLDLDIKAEKTDKSDKELIRKVSIGKEVDNIIMKPRSNESLTNTCSSQVLDPCLNCKPMIPLDDYELRKKHSVERARQSSKESFLLKDTRKEKPIPTDQIKEKSQSSKESFLLKDTRKDKPIPTDQIKENEYIYALVREYIHREMQDISASFRSAIEEIEKANTLKYESISPVHEKPKSECKTDASTSYSTAFIDMIKHFIGFNCQSTNTQTDTLSTNNETDTKNKTSAKKGSDTKNETNTDDTNCIITKLSDQKSYNEIIELVEKQLLDIEDEIEVIPKINSKTSAAKLKAAVMSVPYKDYKRSVTTIRRPINTKKDLFERIKEVYKACSCKICQCITVDSEPAPAVIISDPHKCDCKPCECNDCSRLNKPGLQYSEVELKNCQHKSECNCSTCNCIKCGDSFAISCSCMPCQCIDCAAKAHMKNWKRNKHYVIATAQETPPCVCSPCGCNECVLPGSGISPRLMLDMGTDERRHFNCNCDSCSNDNCQQEGADTCICDRHSKLMRKPVIKDTDEYDIRFAIDCKKNRHPIRDNLTMFATVPNRLQPSDYRNRRIASEESTQYELKDLKASSIESDFWPERLKVKSSPKSIQEACDCKPCECIKCQKHFLEGHIASKRTAQNCSCDICDCITSIEYQQAANSRGRNDICECEPCDCIDCKKTSRTNMCHFCHKQVTGINSVIKVETSSSLVDDNSDNFIKLLKDVPDPNYYIDLILTDKESKNCPNRQEPSDKLHSGVSSNNTVNNSNLHVGQSAVLKILQSNSVKENSINRIDVSNNYLDYQDSKIRNVPVLSLDEYSSMGRNRSSCDYLHEFPPSTVATCIHDVMNIDGFDISEVKSQTSAVKMKLNNGTFKYSNFIPSERICNTEYNLNNSQEKYKKNINWISENTCDYAISDIANYTSKLLDTSCNCNCNNCSCDYIPCLDLGDKEMYIRKTEVTQTPGFEDQDSFIGVQVNSHLRSSLKKPSVSFNHANIDFTSKQSEEYTSINRTLQESKQFSLELLHKLQNIERANENFESIAKDYKTIQGIVGCDKIASEIDSKKEAAGEKCEVLKKSGELGSKINNLPYKIIEKSKKPSNFVKNGYNLEKYSSGVDKHRSSLREKTEEIEETATEYRKVQESAFSKIKILKVAEHKKREANKKLQDFQKKIKANTSINYAIYDTVGISSSTDRSKSLRYPYNTINRSIRKFEIQKKNHSNMLSDDTKTAPNTNEEKELEEHGRKSLDNVDKMKRDLMKVNISNIRKLSKHTILLNWRIPGDLTNVSGYEVMVNGQTVKQVQSPTKNLAVITGLPRSNRVLLTIRTLLHESGAGNRLPCVTCVYNAIR